MSAPTARMPSGHSSFIPATSASPGGPLFLFSVVRAGVFHHFATCLSAFLALLGTSLHVLVVREFLTRLAAFIAGFSAALADRGRKRTVTGHDIRCGSTNVTAVSAQFHRLQVLLLTIHQKLGAVVIAALTLNLTVGACLRAHIEMFAVRTLIALCGGSRPSGEHCDTTGPQRSHHLSTIHDQDSLI